MKTFNFSGSFVACDLKVGRYKQHVELMKWCEEGGGLAGNMQTDRRFMLMEKMSSGGCLPPPPGYIHVYGHNI